MKIYTLTFSNTLNVGAELQMFALYKYLKDNNCDVEVIDYIPAAFEKYRLPTREENMTIYDKLKFIILNYYKIKVIRKYHQFDEQFVKKTKVCKNIHDIEQLPKADTYIVGSDQVWNLEFEIDDVFFLLGKLEGKKISYAASIGLDNPNLEQVKEIQEKTKHFDSISVREDSLKKIYDGFDCKDVTHVLDPVFLLDPSDYVKIQITPKYKKYVFVYCTQRDKKIIETARELADKHGLKVIEMNRLKKQEGVDIAIPYVSPQEFIGFVLNADFIITNSFHCIAFSVIFNKNFYFYNLNKYNSRIKSLLSLIKLDKVRTLGEDNKINLDDCYIDYSEANGILTLEIEKSKEYLLKNI